MNRTMKLTKVIFTSIRKKSCGLPNNVMDIMHSTKKTDRRKTEAVKKSAK